MITKRILGREKSGRTVITKNEVKGRTSITDNVLASIYYTTIRGEEMDRAFLIFEENLFLESIISVYIEPFGVTLEQYYYAFMCSTKDCGPFFVMKIQRLDYSENYSRNKIFHEEMIAGSSLWQTHLSRLGLNCRLYSMAKIQSFNTGINTIHFAFRLKLFNCEDIMREKIEDFEYNERRKINKKEAKLNHYNLFKKESEERRNLLKVEKEFWRSREFERALKCLRKKERLHIKFQETSSRRILEDEEMVTVNEVKGRRSIEKLETCNRYLMLKGKPLPQRVASWNRMRKFNYDVVLKIVSFITVIDMKNILEVCKEVFGFDVLPLSVIRSFGFTCGEIDARILEAYHRIPESENLTSRTIRRLWSVGAVSLLPVKQNHRQVFVQAVNLYIRTSDKRIKNRMLKIYPILRFCNVC